MPANTWMSHHVLQRQQWLDPLPLVLLRIVAPTREHFPSADPLLPLLQHLTLHWQAPEVSSAPTLKEVIFSMLTFLPLSAAYEAVHASGRLALALRATPSASSAPTAS